MTVTTTMPLMTPSRRQSMKDCMEAHVSCVELEARAREMDDLRVDGALLRVIRECAEMCRLTAEAALHDSDSRPAFAKACVEASRRCAEDCARFLGNVEMQRCADVCARAVLACQKLARA
jgi:hypothetical protein